MEKNKVSAFEDECKVINLTNEYTGATKYDGEIKYAIATNRSLSFLEEHFAEEIKQYEPFVIITPKMYEAIKEVNDIEKREQMRALRFHEIIPDDVEDTLEVEVPGPESICESNYTCSTIISKMGNLPKLERSRLGKYAYGYESSEIAQQEGSNALTVNRCLERASGKVRDTFKECGVIYSDYRTLRRGDIVTYDFGDYCGSIQGGYRPAVVLNDSEKNSPSPVVAIVPITTRIKKSEMVAHVVLGKRFGLKKDSMVLTEQARTVNKCSLGIYIGHIDDPKVMQKIDQGLCKSLGIKSGNLTTDNSSSKEVSA